MADRMDIDALLISALYGELTPAEEAQLTAHLESHPADRTALADLRETRAALRESRLLSVQLDPPPSISAMLVREAARRAPSKETEGWFQRFLRSFMAHPAMAAAAMLVLVVGVAGTVYVRTGDHFAQPGIPEAAYQRSMASAQAPTSAAPAAPAPVAASPEPKADQARAEDQKSAGSATADTGYAVRLDESDKQAAALRHAGAKGGGGEGAMGRGTAAKDRGVLGELKSASGANGDGADREIAATTAKLAAPAKKEATGGIELRKQAPEPLDLDDKPQRAKRDRAELSDSTVTATSDQPPGPAAPAPSGPTGNAAPIGGAATAAPVVSPREEAPASPKFAAPVAKSAPPSAIKTKSPAKPVARPTMDKALEQEAAPPPPPPAPAVAAESAPDREMVVTSGAAVDADEDRRAEDPLVTWARKQHNQVRALVAANRCPEAASAASAIYNRAPGYYTQNVVTDPRVRSCMSDLNAMREREQRSRATKRAAPADTKAPTKPAQKK